MDDFVRYADEVIFVSRSVNDMHSIALVLAF